MPTAPITSAHTVDGLLDGPHHIEAADELAGQEQAGVLGEGGVVVPDLDGATARSTYHGMAARHGTITILVPSALPSQACATSFNGTL